MQMTAKTQVIYMESRIESIRKNQKIWNGIGEFDIQSNASGLGRVFVLPYIVGVHK
jgi:hypothetical protein